MPNSPLQVEDVIVKQNGKEVIDTRKPEDAEQFTHKKEPSRLEMIYEPNYPPIFCNDNLKTSTWSYTFEIVYKPPARPEVVQGTIEFEGEKEIS